MKRKKSTFTCETKAQHWAKLRNFDKFRLEGTLSAFKSLTGGNPDNSIVTMSEYHELKDAVKILERVIAAWDSNNDISKNNFLARK